MLEESKKESESAGETETGPDGKPIETTSGAHNSGYLHETETDANGNVIAKPTESHAGSPTDEAETSTEAYRPSSPQDMTTEAPIARDMRSRRQFRKRQRVQVRQPRRKDRVR